MVTTVQTLDVIDRQIQRKMIRQGAKIKEINSSMDKQAEIHSLVSDCRQKTDSSYEILYKHFYSYAMNICFRYSSDMEQAKELLNDGFLKVFTKISSYDYSQPFESWLRQILIDTAVERYHKNQHNNNEARVQELYQEERTLEKLSNYEIVKLTQQLSPTHQIIFSMSVIDGYTHKKIAQALNIPINQSESTLLEARASLKKLLKPNGEPVSACVNFS